jgi:hypothetical protein
MNDLLTPHEVQQFMLDKSEELDEALREYRYRLDAYPEAKRIARVATHNATLAVEAKTVDERKAKAELIAEQQIFAEEQAEALRDSARAAWQTKLAQLNAGQSLSSTVREEMRLAR